MVTRNEMIEFKRELKMTAGILVGFAVAFLTLAGTAHFAFANGGGPYGAGPLPHRDPSQSGVIQSDRGGEGREPAGDQPGIGQSGESLEPAGDQPGQGQSGQGQSGEGGEPAGGGQSGKGQAQGGGGAGTERPGQNQELLLLVNKTHPVDADYKPADLTPIKYYAKDRDAASRYMRKEAAEHFHKLAEGAKADGYEIIMTTAYRSYGFQTVLYNNYVKAHGEKEANTFSAKPGESEHQTGLCTDVSSPSVNYQLTTDYGDAPEGKWLAKHAHEYGFIIRFPKGKEDITGYQYEPWHIRYVGQPAADEIYEKGLTLEEYLGEV